MKKQIAFSIADFAKFTRTTRDTLLYYDKIGLLSPASRGKNNYRFYSHGQLATVNLIRTCQALGMSLAEIKNLSKQRNPEMMDELLKQQIKLIDDKIADWVRGRKLLYVLQTVIHSALAVNKENISVQFMPAEAIVLGQINDYSQSKDDYDALLNFYHVCNDQYPDLDLNYPVWGMFSAERIKQGDWRWPDRYYFYNPEGHDKKPAALYAVGYKRGGYGQTSELYERMLEYIAANGFEICGPTFEEYPLNEICIYEDTDYLVRVMITVQERAKG
ncbi:MAG: MerR family transcriptional regulator [Clostridiales bacterium]|nr:MerR family transcriptional regulator [Clostridiales bacterium]